MIRTLHYLSLTGQTMLRPITRLPVLQCLPATNRQRPVRDRQYKYPQTCSVNAGCRGTNSTTTVGTTGYRTAGTASRQHPNTPANHHHQMPIPPESVMASTYRSDAGTVPHAMHAAGDLTALRPTRTSRAVPCRDTPAAQRRTRESASVESCQSREVELTCSLFT